MEASGVGSNEIRGIHVGGTTPIWLFKYNIDYLTIASEGDAIDFGDITQKSYWWYNSSTSSTRGVFA